MGNSIDKILTVLDADKNGSVSPLEIREWIKDEQWSQNELFSEDYVKDKVKALLAKLDKEFPVLDSKDYKSVSRDELTSFFSSFPEDTVKKLCDSLIREDSERRPKLIENVFRAMDTSGDGKVSMRELGNWIKFEGVFQASHQFDEGKIQDKCRRILEHMAAAQAAADKAKNQLRPGSAKPSRPGSARGTKESPRVIEVKAAAPTQPHDNNDDDELGLASEGPFVRVEDFMDYFKGWTLREVRRVTEDLVKHSFKKEKQIRKIITALDSDRSGEISSNELKEWLKDEQFRNNTRLTSILSKLEAKIAEDEKKEKGSGVHTVPIDQLNWFLRSLNESQFNHLTKYVLTDSRQLMTDLIKEVFDALERDPKQKDVVPVKHIEVWIRDEGMFSERHGGDHKRIDKKLKQILHVMGADGKQAVTFADFSKYFHNCTLREVRMMTHDLITKTRAAAAKAGQPKQAEKKEEAPKTA